MKILLILGVLWVLSEGVESASKTCCEVNADNLKTLQALVTAVEIDLNDKFRV